jgi:DNA processing protein
MSIEIHPEPDANGGLPRSAAGLLALQSLPGIGPAKALRAALFSARFDALLEAHASRWEGALELAHRELEECARQGVTALAIFDERYPGRVRSIHDPPPVLFVRGSLDVLNDERMVALVGTREPTRFGLSAAEEVTEALAYDGWGVVSGLAKGIDTIAHGAALKHRAATVAVLAGGLDRIYPAENRGLAGAIVEEGGALIAEQRWGVRPQRASFVQRNRLQTALAAGVFVAQTGIAGGTMHTARHAAAQGRPLFCPRPHGAHEKNEGLRVLLQAPANELCDILPAWKDARSLCERLGPKPLADAVVRHNLDALLDALALVLSDDSHTHPEPRWWPRPDPPTRLGVQDVVEQDDAQAPLFAFAD